ncbi:Emw1p [Sugiyamaella lignohabitans]|uniref:Emw1p n=1 Tax=Sugiyamaella lignohabitans TaxID=796027 RepID=A0A167FKP0_9ASCO|nr:Emw1p [Sugiyamaella lignohabitans]ANB15422.1 Emw1p [Sugiyamaella lignohabitans]
MSVSQTLSELLVLEGISETEHGVTKLASGIVNGELTHVLNQIITKKNISWGSTTGIEYVEETKQKVRDSDQNEESYLDFLLLAISALQLYIQSNVTGPPVPMDDLKLTISKNVLESVDDKNTKGFFKSCVASLASDGEPAFALMSYPHLLLLSLALLSELKDSKYKYWAFSSWWYSRALLIHQSVIDYPTASIHDAVNAGLNKDTLREILEMLKTDGMNLDDEASNSLVRSLQVRFYVELARAQIVYGHESVANEYIEKAKEASRLEFVLTGVSARRTKFQQHDTSQLVLLAKSFEEKVVVSDNSDIERGLNLNSDLLLERPHYKGLDDETKSNLPPQLQLLDPNNQPALNDVDTAIILLHVRSVVSSTPHKDILIQEELLATVNRIIEAPKSSVNWTLFSSALWNRSLLEADSVKTVERGTLQMQSLVEELGQSNNTYIPKRSDNNSEDPESVSAKGIARRLRYTHQLVPLPKWSMDTALAEKFMSLGALKSAIEVYERLQLWGEAALCYAAVGQEDEGIKILKQHLERNPDDYRGVSILGDITLDPSLWEKAWEMGKYAPSKRSLGQFYYNPPRSTGVERNLDLSIRHLHDSLQVNPLNLSAWFLYGCAGLETSQWELAAEAFTRCVAIEDDNPKNWSNLATALLRLDKKQEAFNALKRASRTATEKQDWRIWSNFITVAGELRQWSDVLQGVKQLILLRSEKEGEKCLEIDLLEDLVQVLIADERVVMDGDATDSSQLQSRANYFFQKSCIDLFIKIIPPLITADPRLWKLISKVHIWLRQPWAALEDFEKGFRIYTHSPLIESDEQVWNEAVDFCSDLVDAYTNFGPMEGKYGEGSFVSKDWKFKARSCIRLLMGKGKNFWEDSEGWQRLQQIKEDL